MKNRRLAPFALIGGGALIIVAVLATLVWFQLGDTPTEAAPKTCEGLAYVSAAPNRTDLAFGPDVRVEITGYDQLSASEQVEAVVAHQAGVWCEFPAIALANAMHRGIRNWPSSSSDWLEQLAVLTENRDAHHQLVGELLQWEADNVVKVEIVYNHETYQSDWFDRSSGTPVLIRGDGHAVEAGWVVRRTLKDGSMLDERLVCSYQLAGEVPPLTPPPPPPPTTTPEEGKDASKRPTQDPVVTCPQGQYADRSGRCVSPSNTTTTVYNNTGGDSGDGAPGPGVTLPSTETSLWQPGDGGGGGSLPPPGE